MYSTAQIEAVQVLFQEKYEESVNRRKTDNTIAKSTKVQKGKQRSTKHYT